MKMYLKKEQYNWAASFVFKMEKFKGKKASETNITFEIIYSCALSDLERYFTYQSICRFVKWFWSQFEKGNL